MFIEGKNYSLKSSRMPKSIGDFPFEKAVSGILGNKKFVSFVFVDSNKIKWLNKNYRHKNKSTDILSFRNGEGGEILISAIDAKKKGNPLPFLLIHGLLHLKGLTHGSKMNKAEIKFCKKFLNGTENHSRHRHRNLRSAGNRVPIRKQ